MLFDLWNRLTDKNEVSDSAAEWRSGMRGVTAVPVLQRFQLSSELRRRQLDFLEHVYGHLWRRITEQNKSLEATSAWRLCMWSILRVADMQH